MKKIILLTILQAAYEGTLSKQLPSYQDSIQSRHTSNKPLTGIATENGALHMLLPIFWKFLRLKFISEEYLSTGNLKNSMHYF